MPTTDGCLHVFGIQQLNVSSIDALQPITKEGVKPKRKSEIEDDGTKLAVVMSKLDGWQLDGCISDFRFGQTAIRLLTLSC
jgi:hypothetical protein